MAQQAQDTFSASPDGIPVRVMKGEVFPDNHPLVKLDEGRGLLFKPFYEAPEPEPPAKGPGLPKRAGKAAG